MCYLIVSQAGAFTQEELWNGVKDCGLALETLEGPLKLRAGGIILVPAGASARLAGDMVEPVVLSKGEDERPVDRLLESLALAKGAQAIAVLLGGEQSRDGEGGLGTVRGERGLAIVLHPGMTDQGMNQVFRDPGVADLALGPVEIADYLERFSASGDEEDPLRGRETELQSIFALLHRTTNVDFESYKWSTVRRRLLKRMLVRQTPRLEEYLEVLRGDSSELSTLYSELLVGVTELFRDPEVFEELERSVIPSIIDGSDSGQPIRIWVPGCSSGDEVFSLAICFLEGLRRRGLARGLQLFATDLNESALSRARNGRYPASLIEALPGAAQGYFVKMADGYQISRTVRELCVFARQDVTQDPPFSHLDLVSCRNLLIYLSVGLQKRALHHFHYAIRQGGFLLLGSSESLGDCEHLFTTINKKHKIFQKRAVPTPSPLNFSRPFAPASSPPHYHAESIGQVDARENDVQKQADRLILARYSPPGVIVDENYEILQFRDEPGPSWSRPSARLPTTFSKWREKGCWRFSSRLWKSLSPRSRRCAARICRCTTTTGFAGSIWTSCPSVWSILVADTC